MFIVSLTAKKRSAEGVVPRHFYDIFSFPAPPGGSPGKAPSHPSVLQAVLVKIVTKRLFCTVMRLWRTMKTNVLTVDHRTTPYNDKDLDHTCQIWGNS